MERIISDAYIKEQKQIFGSDPNTDFNQKIVAVNNLYGWLYEKGILEKASFEFYDYADATEFALDVKDLEPYRKEMESSGVEGASLAVQHIFDEPYTPCMYSGAIELGWFMNTYRSSNGCVGRSHECGLVQNLNNNGIYEVLKVKDERGVKAAVKALYAQFDWELTLSEQRKYQEAVKYFSNEVEANIENDFVKAHAREIIYCYENKKSVIDFDFWTRYETLFDEKMTYDEYIAIDQLYDEDPHGIKTSDIQVISDLKYNLNLLRSSGNTVPPSSEKNNNLQDLIESAGDRAASSGFPSQEIETHRE